MSVAIQKPQPDEIKSMAAKIANDNKARAQKPVLKEVANKEPKVGKEVGKSVSQIKEGRENGNDAGLNANKPDGRER